MDVVGIGLDVGVASDAEIQDHDAMISNLEWAIEDMKTSFAKTKMSKGPVNQAIQNHDSFETTLYSFLLERFHLSEPTFLSKKGKIKIGSETLKSILTIY